MRAHAAAHSGFCKDVAMPGTSECVRAPWGAAYSTSCGGTSVISVALTQIDAAAEPGKNSSAAAPA